VLSTAQIAGLVQEGKKQRNYLDAVFQTACANIPENWPRGTAPAMWNTIRIIRQ